MLKVKDKVRIVHCKATYTRHKVLDAVGIIERIYTISERDTRGPQYGVRIEGMESPNATGLWWFDKHEIEKITEDKNMINVNELVEGYKYCILDNDVPELAVYYGELKEGDVVFATDGGRYVSVVDHLIEADELQKVFENKLAPESEVICKIDTADYDKRRELIKKRKELKAKMEERAAKFQEEQFWKLIAKEDEEMAKLYEEFKGL